MHDIRFSISRIGCDRIYHVTEEDVRVVLSRLPAEVRDRLRGVHFNDRSRGGRVLGYVNQGRREIALCALPPRMSLTRFLVRGQTPKQFGACHGKQWPPLAVRRFMLYDVLLHELGHLQIVHAKATLVRRKFSMETKAQEFGMQWCERLWDQPFDHPDPVHNKPTAQELADKAPRTGNLLGRIRKEPDNAELFQELAKIYHDSGMLEQEKIALDKSHALDPDDPWTILYLGCWYFERGRFHDAIRCHTRAVELMPARSVAYWCLAEALERNGNMKLAETNFAKAVEVESADKTARRKLKAWQNRKECAGVR